MFRLKTDLLSNSSRTPSTSIVWYVTGQVGILIVVTHSFERDQRFLLVSASSSLGYPCRSDCIFPFGPAFSLSRVNYDFRRDCAPQRFPRYSKLSIKQLALPESGRL